MDMIEDETLYAIERIKELLTKVSEEKINRTKIFSEQMGYFLESIPEIFNFVNENDPVLRGKFFSELGYYIKYHKYNKGSVIQHIGSVDDIFYINLTGSILRLDIKYKTFNMTFKDYILYLTKLFLLNEYYMLNEVIKKNNNIFPLPENVNIIKYGYMIKTFPYLQEMEKIKAYKSEILSDFCECHDYKSKIQDLIMLYNPNVKFNNNNFFSCEELTYKICLPFFFVNKIMNSISFLGNLNKILGIKNLSLFICMDDCDSLYLDKTLLKNQNNNKIYNIFNRNKSKFIITNLFTKHYLFQNIDVQFLQKNYAKYFEIIYPEKNEIIIHQNAPRNGVFFINKGVFSITSYKNYNEATLLYYQIQRKLMNNKIEKIETNKNYSEKDISLKKNPIFIKKSNIKQIIDFGIYSSDDIIGLNDIYESPKLSYDFSVECISNGSEIFHVPNEIYNSLIKNSDISVKVNAFIERRLKIFENVIEKFKFVFEHEVKRKLYTEGNKNVKNNNEETENLPFINKPNPTEEKKNMKSSKSTSLSDFNKTKNTETCNEYNFNFLTTSRTIYDNFYDRKKNHDFSTTNKKKFKEKYMSSMNESIKKRMNELSMFYCTTNNSNRKKELLLDKVFQNNQNSGRNNNINDMKKNMNIKPRNGSRINIKILPSMNFRVLESTAFNIRKYNNSTRRKNKTKENIFHTNNFLVDRNNKLKMKMIKVKSQNEN